MMRILLADDDAWLARTLETMLERRGYEVDVVGNGRDALERALERPPDLLITDALMPVLDGWSLVRQLRGYPHLSLLPIIIVSALSSADDRIRGLHLGADHYVAKPFRYEELDLRIARSLQRARQVGNHIRAGLEASCLDGRLSEVGVATLLSFAERELKSGRLVVRSDAGVRAEISMRSGRVVQATLLDDPDREAATCVRDVLEWRDGEFWFVAEEVDVPDRVQMSTTQLLLECARMADETLR